jgi:hypothetical protein
LTTEARSLTRPGTDDGRISLTIGITGHRDLRPADEALYRASIEQFFDTLERTYPATPLRIISALAEGADRLPADIAIQRGYEVFVPVPLPLAEYERDFPESQTEFRELLARIPKENIFELPAVFPYSESGAVDPETLRDLHYAQVGAYIATHCHIVLALWDGVVSDLCGGTSEVVRYKLTGARPVGQAAIGPLELPDTGPVVHLKTRRGAAPKECAVTPGLGALEWRYPDERGSDEFAYIYRRIDTFNGDRARARAAENIRANHPLGEFEAELNKEQRALVRAFNAADALAIHYQRIVDRVLVLLFIVGGAMALFYESFSHMPARALLGGYFITFALVCVILAWQRSTAVHEKYLDYRALAEGLRVQFFWTLAGVHRSVSGSYLRKQNDELQWIREALRKVSHGTEILSCDFLYRAWICDQVKYFRRSATRLEGVVRKVRLVSTGLFAIGLLRTAVLFVMWDSLAAAGHLHHWSVISIASLPVVGALIEAYSERMGYEARGKQHAILAGTFDRAAQAFQRLRESGHDEAPAIRRLLGDLGREALIENADWVLLRRERPMVLPKG